MNKKVKAITITLITFFVLGFSITSNAEKPSSVEVVNTPDVNVVNTADVNVQNEVEIKNDSGNLISVDVGEPTVHVGSMPVALEPEPITASRDYHFTSGMGGAAVIYHVPLEKRLVVEFATANIVLGDSENRLETVYIKTGYQGETDGIEYSAPPMTLFLVDDRTFSEQAVYRGSQQVTIYAGPDQIVSFGLSSTYSCEDGCTFNATISGYLIPVN